MQGFYIASRPIKVNLATKKGEGRGANPPPMSYQPQIYPSSYDYQQPLQPYYQQQPYPSRAREPRGGRFQGPRGRGVGRGSSFSSVSVDRETGESDLNNRTVFVGGVGEDITQDNIRTYAPFNC
jgi:hypothetical protein